MIFGFKDMTHFAIHYFGILEAKPLRHLRKYLILPDDHSIQFRTTKNLKEGQGEGSRNKQGLQVGQMTMAKSMCRGNGWAGGG